MVVQRVVEPVRVLQVGVLGGDDGRVREAGLVHLGEVGRARVVGVVEGDVVDVRVGLGLLRDVVVVTLGVGDDVGGVVGDDVEEDLHALRVRLVDQFLQLGVGAQVRVDLGEVGDPVPVVAGRHVVTTALDGAVLEGGRQPDGGGAQALDVVEPLDQAAQVATVVVALVGRVEPGLQRPAGQPAGVVAAVAVGEPVGHQEVEALPRQARAQRVAGVLPVALGRATCEVLRGDADAVRLVVVGELDAGRSLEHERHVVRGVALGPAVVERHLEVPRARGDVEDSCVRRAVDEGQVGRGALGLPVAGAAELVLQRAGQRHRLGHAGRRWRGRQRGEEQPGRDGEGGGHGQTSA